MKYLLLVPAKAYAIDERRFAVEGAFCEHLKELLEILSPPFEELVLAGPAMSAREYEANRAHLGVLDAEHHRIRFAPLYDAELTHAQFLRRLPSVLARVHRLVRDHDLVHTSPSHDITRPTGSAALALGVLLGKKTIAITDIDNRNDALMNYRLGRWSRKTYLLCRYLYDPIRHLQQEATVRTASLALFKGESLCDDYGAGRKNVRLFHDPAFSAHHVIDDRALEQKIEALQSQSGPLELLYFGRLTYYKGVGRALDALARARQLGEPDVRLTIMGSGDEETALRRKVAQLGLEQQVVFRRPLRYGEPFFATLRAHHLLIAAPLTNDTPRSTWDAMACGIPVLAFDTEFYRGLERDFGVVETVPWPSADALGARIAHYATHRAELAPMMRECVRIARDNTAEHWLRRRAEWTLALFGHELGDFARPDPATFVAA